MRIERRQLSKAELSRIASRRPVVRRAEAPTKPEGITEPKKESDEEKERR